MREIICCLLVAVVAAAPSAGQAPSRQERAVPNGKPDFELKLTDVPPAAYTRHLVFARTKDGDAIYFVNASCLARWDLPRRAAAGETGVEPRFKQFPEVEGAHIWDLILSQDGSRLLVSYGPASMLGSFSPSKPQPPPAPAFFEVWDTEGKELIRTFKPKEDRDAKATLSADGKIVVMTDECAKEKTTEVQFWDVATGKLTHSVAGLFGPLALSPDGRTLAARKWQVQKSEAVLVEKATGKVRATLAQPEPNPKQKERGWYPFELRYAPNGRYVAGRGWDGWVVWDVEGNIVLGKDSEERPTAFCFHPTKGWTSSRGVKALNYSIVEAASTYSPDGKYFAAIIVKENTDRFGRTAKEPSIQVWQVGK